MRRTLCCGVCVSVMSVIACGCGGGGGGSGPSAKDSTTPQAQEAREKDAQEMLKMMDKRNSGQSTTDK